MKKSKIVKARAPDAYLYEKEKKDRKPTDKDLFVMTKPRDKKKSK